MFSLCSQRWAFLSTIPSHGFCRDCLALQARLATRCERCGSPRLARHPELYRLHLAHIDCDAFYAAVEKRDNPGAEGQAGDHRRRQARRGLDRLLHRPHPAACARPCRCSRRWKPARRRWSIKPDMEKYVRVGREVRAMMQALTPLVEPISIDEAFLDLVRHRAAARACRRPWCWPNSRATSRRRSASPFRPACPTASSSPRSRRTSASRAAFR